MRKTLLFLITLFFFGLTFPVEAQSVLNKSGSKTVVFNKNVSLPLNNLEKKMLVDVYGKSLKKNVLDNPQRLKSIKNIIRNRVEIQTINNYAKEYKLLSEVPLFNKYNSSLKSERFRKSTFNPLKYNFDFYSEQVQVFRIDNTNNYILIMPQHQN